MATIKDFLRHYQPPKLTEQQMLDEAKTASQLPVGNVVSVTAINSQSLLRCGVSSDEWSRRGNIQLSFVYGAFGLFILGWLAGLTGKMKRHGRA